VLGLSFLSIAQAQTHHPLRCGAQPDLGSAILAIAFPAHARRASPRLDAPRLSYARREGIHPSSLWQRWPRPIAGANRVKPGVERWRESSRATWCIAT